MTGERWAPDWTRDLSIPVWVSDPDSLLSEVNEEAACLFGRGVGDCLCRPCYEIVRARAVSGAPFCRRRCPIRIELESAMGRNVYHLQIPGGEGRLSPIHVLPIRVKGPDQKDHWLVHCVVEARQCQRLINYFESIAEVSVLPPDAGSSVFESLTIREREILDLLVCGRDMRTVSRQLNISFHTVRNHVQHILTKLSAHSIQQAIAISLLSQTRR